MKKQIITFLILIFTAAGLAAETGYQGFKWYCGINLLPIYKTVELEKEPHSGFYHPMIYEKQIMGEQTYIYMITAYEQFIAAGFIISQEAAAKISKELGPLVCQYNVTTEGRDTKKKDTDAYKDFFILADFLKIAEGIENGKMNINPMPEGKGKITVHNYNDDTYAFEFNNFYDLRTTVVFFPHHRGY